MILILFHPIIFFFVWSHFSVIVKKKIINYDSGNSTNGNPKSVQSYIYTVIHRVVQKVTPLIYYLVLTIVKE